MRSLAAVLLACLLFAPALTSQISRVRGTGCPGAAYPTPTPNAARLGQRLNIRGAGICAGRMPGIFLFGNPIRVPVGPPVTCVQNCVLGVLPLVLLTTPSIISVTIPIPNDRRLITATFYVQTGCQTVRRCFDLHGALAIAIQP